MIVDTNSIVGKYPPVEEILEEVGTWKVLIDGCPVQLKVKVVRHHNLDLPYMGIANYEIQGPTQGHPYRSIKNWETVHEALDDAIRGFLHFFKPELVDQTKFVLDEDW